MDINHLRNFIRVAELKSFSRAASMLDISQPALSKQIAGLEHELKEPLLIRTGRGVTLTEAGQCLLEHARNLLQDLSKTYVAIDNIRKCKSGRVTIGMPAIISSILAVPIIHELRVQLSDAEVSIVHGQSRKLQEWLLSGQIDMALMFNAPSSPLLESLDISHDPLWLLGDRRFMEGRKQARVSLLSELPMIIGTRANNVRVILEAELSKSGASLDVIFELEAFEPRVELAREGFGCTVASSWGLSNRQLNFAGLIGRQIVSPELRLSAQLVLPARRVRNKLHEATFGIVQKLGKQMLHDNASAKTKKMEIIF